MLIRVFLAALLQRAGHPVPSPPSSLGCPLCWQHGRVLQGLMGTWNKVLPHTMALPHTTALPRSHWALKGKTTSC